LKEKKVILEHVVFGNCWVRSAIRGGTGAPMFEAQANGSWRLLLAETRFWHEEPQHVTVVFTQLEKQARKRLIAQQGDPNVLRRTKEMHHEDVDTDEPDNSTAAGIGSDDPQELTVSV